MKTKISKTRFKAPDKWKRTNRQLGNKKLVYSNYSSPDLWVGVGKNEDGSWTVMTATGLQRAPFPNKQQALDFAKFYMKHNEEI